ncbi:MAG: hypothetical protein ACE5KG_01780 [Nitrososphaerales archaeon]
MWSWIKGWFGKSARDELKQFDADLKEAFAKAFRDNSFKDIRRFQGGTLNIETVADVEEEICQKKSQIAMLQRDIKSLGFRKKFIAKRGLKNRTKREGDVYTEDAGVWRAIDDLRLPQDTPKSLGDRHSSFNGDPLFQVIEDLNSLYNTPKSEKKWWRLF